jgi:SAM-dependent methyltransferase
MLCGGEARRGRGTAVRASPEQDGRSAATRARSIHFPLWTRVAKVGRNDAPIGTEERVPEKRYDQAYFDRWYRGTDEGVGDIETLERNVALAVAVAESVLDSPLESVLDVGCGEGRWQPILGALRPEASYLGIDSSEYAIERFGEERNLRQGTFGALAYHVFDAPFDLVVCSDVLHYLDEDEIRRGLPALEERCGGVALLETFTTEDDPEGDRDGFHLRPASWYRSLFSEAGFVAVGLQLYVPSEIAEDLDHLDLPA